MGKKIKNIPVLDSIQVKNKNLYPFCDGNGRIGRLLIPLYFISKNLLKKPSLYLSDYFERNRSSYYDALDYPRKKNDLSQWIKFFLNGMIETSKNGIITFNKILELKNRLEKIALSMNRRADSALKLINFLYRKPVVHYQNVCEELSLTPRPANELLKVFIDKGILVEITGKQRNKKYGFAPYLEIFVRHNEANNDIKI
jgi:Fic family protein